MLHSRLYSNSYNILCISWLCFSFHVKLKKCMKLELLIRIRQKSASQFSRSSYLDREFQLSLCNIQRLKKNSNLLEKK